MRAVGGLGKLPCLVPSTDAILLFNNCESLSAFTYRTIGLDLVSIIGSARIKRKG